MKYKHEKEVHNLSAPNKIVPVIIKLLSPKSVVDIGCGTGTFLNVFKGLGVTDILGVDGAWVNKKFLYENINPDEFFEFDLENRIILPKKYDLVLSLEVAEHLDPKSADIFVESLVNAGNLIVFSAAIPKQGGQNHINEQWLTYWEEKFSKYDYVIHDILRPIFWDDPDVFYWYKQNMIILAPRDLKLSFNESSIPILNIVHYDMFLEKAETLEKITKGRYNPLVYIAMLIISILGYNFLVRILGDNFLVRLKKSFSKFNSILSTLFI